jgi:peptidoglycan/xylan/chitin deacetylase (PgdA/CDA1 family)
MTDRRPSVTEPQEPMLKRIPKAAFYWLCLQAGPAGLQRIWFRLRRRTRCTVLVYHRVNEVSRDNLTTIPARFAEHLATIKRHYPVLSLSAAVAALSEGQYLGPNVVVITFDDGYADNYENAAPILERFGLPATFFVTAALVGTRDPFEHDRKSPHRFENLTWEQVRSLVARGFEVGSHGLTHRNLARCSAEEARREIFESRAILERELGLPVRSFAYPFGGQDDVTPEVLTQIRAAGYQLIASAYGGCNLGAIEPLNILRIGMSGAFDTLALRATVEGVSLQGIRQRLASGGHRPGWETSGSPSQRSDIGP